MIVDTQGLGTTNFMVQFLLHLAISISSLTYNHHLQVRVRVREQESPNRTNWEMASITMTASFLGGVSLSNCPSAPHRGAIMTKAMKAEAGDRAVKLNCHDATNKANNGRREAMLAAAAAICCIASGRSDAIAGEDPKPGTPEAKKIYAPVCVTMPTARICHKWGLICVVQVPQQSVTCICCLCSLCGVLFECACVSNVIPVNLFVLIEVLLLKHLPYGEYFNIWNPLFHLNSLGILDAKIPKSVKFLSKFLSSNASPKRVSHFKILAT